MPSIFLRHKVIIKPNRISKIKQYYFRWGFPGDLDGKESACNVGDLGSIPGSGSITGSGRSSGEGNGNPPQYSCLENPMDRRAW